MKKVLIIALVCINVGLVLALVFGMNQSPAKAQVRGNADYLVVTGRVANNTDAVYILDLGKQRLLALEPDPNRQMKLQTYLGRKLKEDFVIKEEK